jgi:hypothetical protein
MEEYLKWLEDNQWLNLIFLILALIGVIVSIFLYRKSNKRKRPVFAIRSINVISEDIKRIGGVEINYKSDIIDNLTVTKVAFWNSGNDTINDIDQAPTDKLRIELDNQYTILESELLFQSSNTNNIRINNSNNKIYIQFDYLDSNEGGIIKFIHTGKKSSDVKMKGTFKGSDKLKYINTGIFNLGNAMVVSLSVLGAKIDPPKNRRLVQQIFPWIVLVTGLIIGIGGAFFFSTDHTERLVLSTFGAGYSLLGLIMIFGRIKLPKGFDLFYDDE